MVMTKQQHKCTLNANLRQIIGPVFQNLYFKNGQDRVGSIR